MSDSKISWTTKTWNPTTGCDQVSPGCDHCYALTLAARLKRMGNKRYQNDGNPKTSGPGFALTLHPDKLDEPLKWYKPARVFVNSMSDLFHDDVPDKFIAEVFAVMALADRHTFQVLTKRPRRMQRLLSLDGFADECDSARLRRDPYRLLPDFPPPNVWLGTSVEDQKRADLRVSHLLNTDAAVRFLSCEPLLGPVDLTSWLSGLHWVIAGGESGPDYRPMNLDWARSLRDQCVEAGVPFFFKQGSGIHSEMHKELDGRLWAEMPDESREQVLAK